MRCLVLVVAILTLGATQPLQAPPVLEEQAPEVLIDDTKPPCCAGCPCGCLDTGICTCVRPHGTKDKEWTWSSIPCSAHPKGHWFRYKPQAREVPVTSYPFAQPGRGTTRPTPVLIVVGQSPLSVAPGRYPAPTGTPARVVLPGGTGEICRT